MPTCNITINLVQISHFGRFIGDDWSYTITVGGVPKTIPEAPGRGGNRTSLRVNRNWALIRECRTRPPIPVILVAREHDIFFDDSNIVRTAFNVLCPGPGRPNVVTRYRRVTVTERPGGSRGNSVIFKFEITSNCT